MTGAGAVHISLNSLAGTFMTKALQRLAEQHGLALGKPDAKSLAERCGGDLSHAIEMLQLVSAGQPCSSPPQLPAAKVCADVVSAHKTTFGTCRCKPGKLVVKTPEHPTQQQLHRVCQACGLCCWHCATLRCSGCLPGHPAGTAPVSDSMQQAAGDCGASQGDCTRLATALVMHTA